MESPNSVACGLPSGVSHAEGTKLLVSVIIPVRNDAACLEVCLRSLRRQSYPDCQIEIIVVDNGSTDSSCEVAQKHGAKTLTYPKLRVGALRNRGVAAASGEVLAFVDSDHEVPEGWIKSAVDQLLGDRSIKMIGSHYLAPADGTWVQRCWQHHRLRYSQRRTVDWLGAGNMFLWKCDFIVVGGFREDLTACEDVDLSVRIVKLGDIVCDMQVANTHHGEPKTLLAFARKELWRGTSGLTAYVGHGMPLHEVRSLLWPLYHLAMLIAVIVSAVGLALGYGATALIVCALLLVSPSAMLALKICLQIRHMGDMLPLTALYIVYGLVRGIALFKR